MAIPIEPANIAPEKKLLSRYEISCDPANPPLDPFSFPYNSATSFLRGLFFDK